MTVAPTGYLKSHPATKQEAQLQKLSSPHAVYEKELEQYKAELVVHNLSKNRVVNKVEYDYAELLDVFHVRRYVHILLNSFIVVFKIKDNKLKLYLFDLISETTDTFVYTPYDYM